MNKLHRIYCLGTHSEYKEKSENISHISAGLFQWEKKKNLIKGRSAPVIGNVLKLGPWVLRKDFEAWLLPPYLYDLKKINIPELSLSR